MARSGGFSSGGIGSAVPGREFQPGRWYSYLLDFSGAGVEYYTLNVSGLSAVIVPRDLFIVAPDPTTAPPGAESGTNPPIDFRLIAWLNEIGREDDIPGFAGAVGFGINNGLYISLVQETVIRSSFDRLIVHEPVAWTMPLGLSRHLWFNVHIERWRTLDRTEPVQVVENKER